MDILRLIKREIVNIPLLTQGYSREQAVQWYKSCRRDLKSSSGRYSKDAVKRAHKRGYNS